MYQKRTVPVPYTGKNKRNRRILHCDDFVYWSWWYGSRSLAHGENAEYHARRGTEVMSKRLKKVNGWDITNPDYKTFTHRIERRIAKREIYAALREVA